MTVKKNMLYFIVLKVFCDRTVIWVDSPLQSKPFTYSKILEKSTKIWLQS